MKESNYKFSQGVRDGIPIALGYLSVSFGFGITAVNGGLTVLEALLISMTNLTSAGQVAGLRYCNRDGYGATYYKFKVCLNESVFISKTRFNFYYKTSLTYISRNY